MTIKKPYEKPKLISLKKQQIGYGDNCTPSGSGAAHNCLDGISPNLACSNYGNLAKTGCFPEGNSDADNCQEGFSAAGCTPAGVSGG